MGSTKLTDVIKALVGNQIKTNNDFDDRLKDLEQSNKVLAVVQEVQGIELERLKVDASVSATAYDDVLKSLSDRIDYLEKELHLQKILNSMEQNNWEGTIRNLHETQDSVTGLKKDTAKLKEVSIGHHESITRLFEEGINLCDLVGETLDRVETIENLQVCDVVATVLVKEEALNDE